MLIRECISDNFPATDAWSGLIAVEKELTEKGFLVVMDAAGFCGILTPADVLLNPKKLVIDCLSKKENLNADENIVNAWMTICESRSPALAVFEADVFLGIVEKRNIVHSLIEEMGRLDRQSLISKRVKNEFLQTLSHEIRTPLNGILGFLNLLAEMDLDKAGEKYRQFANIINSNTDSFLLIMNDLIELSLKQSGEELPVQKEMVSVETLFEELKGSFEQNPLVQMKQLTISCTESESPTRLLTDSEKLKHMLYHLVDHAMKLSRKKSRVKFGIEKTTDSLVTFFVSSSAGSRQRSPSLQSQESGWPRATLNAGIGLTLVKYFAECLNGKIEMVTGNDTETYCVSIPLIR